MAGNYYHDPRPFYNVTGDQKLYSLDDCFNFVKKEPKFIESEYKVKQGGKQGDNKNNKGNQDGEKVEKSKIQTIELNVSLCCDSCEWKVKEALDDVEGVEKVDCDQLNRKVFVKGSVKPEVVLKKVKTVRKDAELVVKKKQN